MNSEERSLWPDWNFDEISDPGRALALTIDLNIGFTRTGALASPRVGAILPSARNFLAQCRQRRIFAAAVTDCHTQESSELFSYPPHCLEGTVEPELAPEIAEFQQAVLYKNSTNAFFAPGMDKLLEDIQTVIVIGCCTDICIQQFAVTLKAFANQNNRTLEVIVPCQLVETYDAPGHPAELRHQAALAYMAENGVKVVNCLPTK